MRFICIDQFAEVAGKVQSKNDSNLRVSAVFGSSASAAQIYPFGRCHDRWCFLRKGMPMENLAAYIGKLSSNSLMTAEERNAIVRTIIAKQKDTPVLRILVFGVGNDSPLWTLLNPCGETYFIEDDEEWAERVCRIHHVSESQVLPVKYEKQSLQYKKVVNELQAGAIDPYKIFRRSCDADVVRNSPWDIVIVDGPKNVF
jgi:hypothetical protein